MLAGGAELGLAGHRVDLLAHLGGRRHRRGARSASVSSATVCSTMTRGWWKTATPLAMPATSFSPVRRWAPRRGAGVARLPSDQAGVGDQLATAPSPRSAAPRSRPRHSGADRHAGRRARRSRFRGGRSARRRSCGSSPRRFRGDRRSPGWLVASARLRIRPSAAIVPTSPSPSASRVTWTASLFSPWVANSSSLPSRSDVDRADLALHRLGDQVDDMVELGLRTAPLGHHVVKTGEDLARGNGGGQGHGDAIAGSSPPSKPY